MGQLAFRELATLSRLKTSQSDPAKPDPLQFQDLVPDRIHDATNDAVPTLVNRDEEPA